MPLEFNVPQVANQEVIDASHINRLAANQDSLSGLPTPPEYTSKITALDSGVARVDPGVAGSAGQALIRGPSGPAWARTHHHVDAYGAVGDGVANDTDAIRLAITTAGIEQTLWFAPGKTYLLDGRLAPLAGQVWMGYGATLKRRNVLSTATTTTITTTGNQSVGVSSVAAFRVGMDVSVFAGTSHDTSNHRIASISGNTLTLETTFAVGFATGATLYTSMSVIQTGSQRADRLKILGLEIDGNRANNALNAKWQNHDAISVFGDDIVIKHCYIHDEQCEGIVPFGNRAVITENVLINIGGNGIHFSDATGDKVTHNHVENCNLVGVSAGHADGCIIASNLVYDTLIDSNVMINGISGVGSWDSSDNAGLTVTNNVIRNMTSYALEMVCSTGQYTEAFVVSGNRIYDSVTVGLIQVNTATPINVGPRKGIFSDNLLINTRLTMTRVFDVQVTNNTFDLPSTNTTDIVIDVAGGSGNVIAGNTTRCGGFGIYLSVGAAATVSGNTIRNAFSRGVSVDGETPGVVFADNMIESDTSVSTSYYGAVLKNGNAFQGNTIRASQGLYGVLCPNGGAGVAGGLVIHNVIRTPTGMPSVRIGGGALNNIAKGNYVTVAVSNSAVTGDNTVSDNTTVL